jgi:N-acyl amino acid synthase of PEP-CTERM/exosortase system
VVLGGDVWGTRGLYTACSGEAGGETATRRKRHNECMAGNDAIGIEHTWDHYFEVVLASTPALLGQIYALRYQVYCIEHRFEDPANHPNGRETDSHDQHSLHVALIYRASREVVGTVRLIFPANPIEPRLPILSLLGQDAQAELRRYPLDRMAEISRYVVSKTFRRRKGEDEFPDVGFSPDVENGRRLMPHLTLGLMRGILQLGVSRQVQYLCACMRPALLRLLRQLGLKFRPIGPAVDYHGLRQPCIASIDDLLLGLKTHSAELCSVVHRGSILPPETRPTI